MKKVLFILAILMAINSVCINAQYNQSKLNQVELSKKLTGVWQQQNAKDTISAFEMSSYKNAVLETMYRTINGVKELMGTISFTYDPKSDNFKGFLIDKNGQLQPYHFKFSSDKEVVFEWVENFETNKLMARNTGIFVDPEHLTVNHYNGDEVQYGSSKYVRTSSGH